MFKYVFFTGLCFALFRQAGAQAGDNWCNQKPRAQFSTLKPVHTSRPWFKVYDVGNNVYAITEPYNYQEVIPYLIIGKDSALLFDTGMGLDSISLVVKELTKLPVIVINSHTHYDHIGGNAEFTNIIAVDTPFTIHNAQYGWAHNVVKDEVTPGAVCFDKLANKDTAAYCIRPFHVKRFVKDGYIINLGGRQLKVIATPGHTPDAIALLDKANGCLFTGDSFYEGTIWLFAYGTNLKAYQKSMAKLAKLQPVLKILYTSHNTPVAQPSQLSALNAAINDIKGGNIKGVDAAKVPGYSFAAGAMLYNFKTFSLLIRQHQL